MGEGEIIPRLAPPAGVIMGDDIETMRVPLKDVLFPRLADARAKDRSRKRPDKKSASKRPPAWNKGRVAWNRGLKTPEETKAKISASLKGKPQPWDHGAGMRGRHHTDEAKEKIRQTKVGDNNPMSKARRHTKC